MMRLVVPTAKPSARRSTAVLKRCAPPLGVAALLVTLAGCGLPGSDSSGDPCLLQQYQSRSFGIVRSMQSAVNTLATHADALTSSDGSIDATQDISQTETTLAEFHLALTSQLNLLRMGWHPTQGSAFEAQVKMASQRLERGAWMLDQAYADAAAGDNLTAKAVAMSARQVIGQGRILLDQANSSAAALATYSPNC